MESHQEEELNGETYRYVTVVCHAGAIKEPSFLLAVDAFVSLVLCFCVLVQVQSASLQQTHKRQHLYRDRLREVPHLSGEFLQGPKTPR